MRIGQYLKQVRQERGLTLAAVANQLGHNRSWLHRKESGVRTLSFSEVAALAEIYGQPPSELIAGWEEQKRANG